MVVGVGQRGARGKRGSIDPVQPRTRHLHELESRGRRAHLAREAERDQDVDLREQADHAGLLGQDHLALHVQVTPHPIREPDREGPGEANLHVRTIWV